MRRRGRSHRLLIVMARWKDSKHPLNGENRQERHAGPLPEVGLWLGIMVHLWPFRCSSQWSLPDSLSFTSKVFANTSVEGLFDRARHSWTFEHEAGSVLRSAERGSKLDGPEYLQSIPAKSGGWPSAY